MKNKIDRIVLGDNQFFGVNHMYQMKGEDSYKYFKDINKIKELIYFCMDQNVKGIMLSTFPAIFQITDMIRNDNYLKRNLNIYPNIPYIAKYVRFVNQMGIFGTLRHVFKNQTIQRKLYLFLNGGKGFIFKDYKNLFKKILDIELAPFKGLNIKAVFFHNVFVDLILGYDLIDIFDWFSNHVNKEYGAIPGFGTLNFSLFQHKYGTSCNDEIVIMTSVNKKGLYMNPSQEEVEYTLQNNRKYSILAMSTLAGGRLTPDEAFKYIFDLNKELNVVVGFSTKKHGMETIGCIKSYIERQ